MWLVPALLFIILAIAVSIISAISLAAYISASAATNQAYGDLAYSAYYIIELGNSGQPPQGPPPNMFMSAEGLSSTINGVWTMQYFGLAAILLLITLILVAAYAYARALTLGLATDVMAGKPQNLFSMFRHARTLWLPCIWYVLPFALIVWATIVAAIPLWLRDLALDVIGTPSVVSLFDVLLIFSFVLLILLAAITVFAEGVIASGSRKPLRESAVAAALRPLRALGAIALCTLIAASFIGLDYLRTLLIYASSNFALSIALLILFVILVAAWRMWAAAFAMNLWPAKSQTKQTPRGE